MARLHVLVMKAVNEILDLRSTYCSEVERSHNSNLS